MISFCTKPELPTSVNELRTKIVNLENKLGKRSTLDKLFKALKKGLVGISNAWSILQEECHKHVPLGTAPDQILSQLTKVREDRVSTIFKGALTLADYTDVERKQNSADEASLVSTVVSESLIEKYIDLIKLNTLAGLIDKVRLYDLGVKFLAADSTICPLCGQSISGEINAAVHGEHKKLADKKMLSDKLSTQKTEVKNTLSTLRNRLDSYHSRHIAKANRGPVNRCVNGIRRRSSRTDRFCRGSHCLIVSFSHP